MYKFDQHLNMSCNHCTLTPKGLLYFPVSCPSGWKPYPSRKSARHCYQWNQAMLTWGGARQHCRNQENITDHCFKSEWSTLIGRDPPDTVLSLVGSYWRQCLCHNNTAQGMQNTPIAIKTAVFSWHQCQ